MDNQPQNPQDQPGMQPDNTQLPGLSWQEGLGTLGNAPYTPPSLPYSTPQPQYPEAEYVSPPIPPMSGDQIPQVNPHVQQNTHQEQTAAQPLVAEPAYQSVPTAAYDAYQASEESSRRKKLFIIIGSVLVFLVLGAILAALLSGKEQPAEPITSSTTTTPKDNTPSTPKNVSAISDLTGQAVISWILDDTSNEYLIEFTKDENFLLDVQSKKAANTSTSTLSELEPGETYYIRIATKNSAGTSDYSKVVKLVIKQADTPAEAPSVPAASLPAPSKPTTNSATTSTLIVNWSGVVGAQKYRVEFSRTNNFAKIYIEEPGSTSIKLTGLAASMTYYIRVAAIQNGIVGTWSAVGQGTTTAASNPTPAPTPTPTPTPNPSPTPGIPTSITLTLGPVTSTGGTYITTSWKPTATATRIELLWTGPNLANQPRSPNNELGVNTDRAFGLRENTRYCFKVREYIGSTVGAWSSEICRTTNKR